MNSLRYIGKTWKVGDFVYRAETRFWPSRFGHILKLHKEECQDAYSVGLFSYIAEVVWQNGQINKINLEHLELVNE